jgi:Ca2+-binding RTX toxin-like protein
MKKMTIRTSGLPDYIDDVLNPEFLAKFGSWSGTQLTPASITYSFLFLTDEVGNPDYSQSVAKRESEGFGVERLSTVDMWQPLTERYPDGFDKTNIEMVLQEWKNYAHINFTENDSIPNVRIGLADTSSFLGPHSGYTYIDTASIQEEKYQQAEVYLSPSLMQKPTDSSVPDIQKIDPQTWIKGSLAYDTLLHETGHALGFGHSDGYNKDYSIMNYNDGMFVKGGLQASPDKPFAITPMVYDIAAIQYLYSANMTHHDGNNTYNLVLDTDISGYTSTIWDAGGIDKITAVDYRGDDGVRIDLREGVQTNEGIFSANIEDTYYFSAVSSDVDINDYLDFTFTKVGNTVTFNAFGSQIEHAVGSDANDVLIGNDAYEAGKYKHLPSLAAFSGNNKLEGGKGSDLLIGLSGNDTLIGGVYGNTHEDSHNDNNTGSDNDVDIGLFTFAVASSDAGQVPVDGNDWLDGGEDDDWLDGGAGDDSLTGGAGKDVFSFQKDEHSTDRIMDFVSGEDKIDLSQFQDVNGIGDVAISGNAITFASSEGQQIIVNAPVHAWDITFSGGNYIIGTPDNDTLTGGSSSDTLVGGSGDDVLGTPPSNGNDDSDNHVDDSFNDSFNDLDVGVGLMAFSAMSDSFAAVKGDSIDGGAGNDTLYSGIGSDTLTGGAGFDVFVFSGNDADEDIITDFALGEDSIDLSAMAGVGYGAFDIYADGSDTRISIGGGQSIRLQLVDAALVNRSSFVLDPNANNAPEAIADAYALDAGAMLTVDAAQGVLANDVDTEGDALSITLISDVGHGTLTLNADGSFSYQHDGLGSLTDSFSYLVNDGQYDSNVVEVSFTINSQDHAFTYGTNGNDVFSASKKGSHYDGQGGNDTILGLQGNDYLRGGDGNDVISSGGGKDTLEGGSGNDILSGSTGKDVLYGDDGNDILLGNNGNDDINGGAGNDNLFGGNGSDTLVGGMGKDTLYGDNGPDVFVYGSLQDSTDIMQDIIVDFSKGDKIDLSGLGFTSITQGMGAGTTLGYTQSWFTTTIHDAESDFSIQLLGHHTLHDGDFVF